MADQRTLSVEGHDGLDGNMDGVELILLEHGLDHELTVAEGVHGRLGEENLAVAGVDLRQGQERGRGCVMCACVRVC